jgi:hypothetical protein
MFVCEFCFTAVRRAVYTDHIVLEHNQPAPEGWSVTKYQEQSKWVYTDGEIIGVGEDHKEVANGK